MSQITNETALPEEFLERLMDGLTGPGFHVEKDFLSSKDAQALIDDFHRRRSQGEFHRAGVGKKQQFQIADEIRRDEVLWFELEHLSTAQELLWRRLEVLRENINRSLFLGLRSLEGHFAFYPPGGFYRRHLDRFNQDDARMVSVVLYLNRSWKKGDGGELEIFLPETNVLVEPRAGTLVVFLSDRIEHQVRASEVERASFAGWYKRSPTRAVTGLV